MSLSFQNISIALTNLDNVLIQKISILWKYLSQYICDCTFYMWKVTGEVARLINVSGSAGWYRFSPWQRKWNFSPSAKVCRLMQPPN